MITTHNDLHLRRLIFPQWLTYCFWRKKSLFLVTCNFLSPPQNKFSLLQFSKGSSRHLETAANKRNIICMWVQSCPIFIYSVFALFLKHKSGHIPYFFLHNKSYKKTKSNNAKKMIWLTSDAWNVRGKDEQKDGTKHRTLTRERFASWAPSVVRLRQD